MSYVPDRIVVPEEKHQVIGVDEDPDKLPD
jgi:hypothetical protein